MMRERQGERERCRNKIRLLYKSKKVNKTKNKTVEWLTPDLKVDFRIHLKRQDIQSTKQ